MLSHSPCINSFVLCAMVCKCFSAVYGSSLDPKEMWRYCFRSAYDWSRWFEKRLYTKSSTEFPAVCSKTSFIVKSVNYRKSALPRARICQYCHQKMWFVSTYPAPTTINSNVLMSMIDFVMWHYPICCYSFCLSLLHFSQPVLSELWYPIYFLQTPFPWHNEDVLYFSMLLHTIHKSILEELNS